MVHLMNKRKNDLDRRGRSHMKVKGHKTFTNGHVSQTIILEDIIPGTKVQKNKRHQMT